MVQTYSISTILAVGAPSLRDNLQVVRFRSRADADRVTADIDSVISCPLGAVFADGPLRAIVARPDHGEWESESVLYLNRGALAAARLAGLRMPLPEGTISPARLDGCAVLIGYGEELSPAV